MIVEQEVGAVKYFVKQYPNYDKDLIVASNRDGCIEIYTYAGTPTQKNDVPKLIHDLYIILVNEFIMQYHISDFTYVLLVSRYTSADFTQLKPKNIKVIGEGEINYELLPLCFSKDERWSAKKVIIDGVLQCDNSRAKIVYIHGKTYSAFDIARQIKLAGEVSVAVILTRRPNIAELAGLLKNIGIKYMVYLHNNCYLAMNLTDGKCNYVTCNNHLLYYI